MIVHFVQRGHIIILGQVELQFANLVQEDITALLEHPYHNLVVRIITAQMVKIWCLVLQELFTMVYPHLMYHFVNHVQEDIIVLEKAQLRSLAHLEHILMKKIVHNARHVQKDIIVNLVQQHQLFVK